MRFLRSAKGKLTMLLALAGVIGAAAAAGELRHPEYERTITDEMIHVSETEGNDSGYVTQKQVFFDRDCGYPAQYTTPEISLRKGKYRITVDYSTENKNRGGKAAVTYTPMRNATGRYWRTMWR